jgi:hypothetical protein
VKESGDRRKGRENRFPLVVSRFPFKAKAAEGRLFVVCFYCTKWGGVNLTFSGDLYVSLIDGVAGKSGLLGA